MKKLKVQSEDNTTTKNDLRVDCISRAEMLKYQEYLHGKMSNEENHKLWEFIKELPSVTPQEPTTKNDLVPRKVVERIIKSPRTQEQMLLMLNSIHSVILQEPKESEE